MLKTKFREGYNFTQLFHGTTREFAYLNECSPARNWPVMALIVIVIKSLVCKFWNKVKRKKKQYILKSDVIPQYKKCQTSNFFL